MSDDQREGRPPRPLSSFATGAAVGGLSAALLPVTIGGHPHFLFGWQMFVHIEAFLAASVIWFIGLALFAYAPGVLCIGPECEGGTQHSDWQSS